MFAHVPGLKVVMPSTPRDAKGLMVSAIKDDNPVVIIDDRWLHGIEDDVPEPIYEVPIGKGAIVREGRDLTLVGISYMVPLAVKAAAELEKKGFDIEVLDVRTVKPLDRELLLESVRKTGRLVVCDGAWRSFGAAGEIEAVVFEEAFDAMKRPPVRVTLPDMPAPAARTLEKAYYPTEVDIVDAVRSILE
jgi:pyruvate dehydrogenase E1 component beta subunit